MSSFTSDGIPIFRESTTLSTGINYTTKVVKKELVDNELHTYLEVVDAHIFIIVIGFVEMNVGSIINILLGEDTCRFISYVQRVEPRYISWNKTSEYTSYNKNEGLILIAGGILLSTLLFISGIIIAIPAACVAITGALIIIHISKLQVVKPLVSHVTCKILDMSAEYHYTEIRGHLLLAGIHKDGKSEIFELPAVGVLRLENDIMYFKDYELRLGDIVTFPVLGSNYLSSYITGGV